MYVGSKYRPRHLIMPAQAPEERLRGLLAKEQAGNGSPTEYEEARYHRIGDEHALRAALARHAAPDAAGGGSPTRADRPPDDGPAAYRTLLRQLRRGEPLCQFILRPAAPKRDYLTTPVEAGTLLGGRFTLAAILDVARYAVAQAMGAGRLPLLAADRRGQLASYAVWGDALAGFARSEAHFQTLPVLLDRTEKLEAATWLKAEAIREAASEQAFTSFFEEGTLQIWTGPRWVEWALGQMPAEKRKTIIAGQITAPDHLPSTDG